MKPDRNAPRLGEVADALRHAVPSFSPFAGYALRAGLIGFLPGYRPEADWQRQPLRLKRRWWQLFPVKKHEVVFWVAEGALRRVCIDGRVVYRASPFISSNSQEKTT